MSRRIVLPGSEDDAADAAARGGGTRLSEEDAAALAGLIQWWRHRLARADATNPPGTAFGGVDESGTARTVGSAPATVAFGRPLPRGSYLVHALGIPEDAAAAGEVFSLVGLCHFHQDPAAGCLCRYATLGRAPGETASTEVRAATPGGAPAILIAGVGGLVIDWRVEAYGLEGG